MDPETRKDLKLSGNMTIPGGIFKRVEISGIMTFDGDMDCLGLDVNGAFINKGNLKFEKGDVHGSFDARGDVKAGEMGVYGTAKITGDMSVDKLNAEGMLDIKGGLTSEDAFVSGILNVRGDCDAERLTSEGSFNVEGVLNADIIEARMYSPCDAKEIVGGKINVRKGGDRLLTQFVAAFFNPLGYYKAHLTVDLIEGDEVRVEHTTAKIIRGNTVVIGDGCKIDLVEYRTDFQKASETSVLKDVKI